MNSSTSASVPKRLFVLCDGTWQDSINGKSPPTNIATFARCLDHVSRDGFLQLTYYDSGIGNGTSRIGQVIDGMTGRGISAKIRNAYSFISRNYNFDGRSRNKKPDEIVLVGYSRGAFAVQCVASLIDRVGLLEAQHLYYLQGLFDLWANQELEPTFPSRTTAADTSRSLLDDRVECLKDLQVLRPVEIKALLVWDTVSALGLPLPFGHAPLSFVGREIPGIVKNAFQALALDETRTIFSPQIWQSRQEGTHAKQCWFKGKHVDVGGNGDAELGATTLLWMIGQVTKETGISFSKDEIRRHLQHKYLDWTVKIGWLGYVWDTAELSPLLGTGNVSPLSWYWWAFRSSPRTPYSLRKHGSSEDNQFDVKTNIHITVRLETEENAVLGAWDAQNKVWRLGDKEIPECFLRSVKDKLNSYRPDELYWLKVWMNNEEEDERTPAVTPENKTQRRRRNTSHRNTKSNSSRGSSTRAIFVDRSKSRSHSGLKGGSDAKGTGPSQAGVVEQTAPREDGIVKQAALKDDDIVENAESKREAFKLVQDEDSAIRLSDFVEKLKKFLTGSSA